MKQDRNRAPNSRDETLPERNKETYYCIKLGCVRWTVSSLTRVQLVMRGSRRPPNQPCTSGLSPCEAPAGPCYTSLGSWWSTWALMEAAHWMDISVCLCLTRTPAVGVTHLDVLCLFRGKLPLDVGRKPLLKVMLLEVYYDKGVLQFEVKRFGYHHTWRNWNKICLDAALFFSNYL